MKTQGHIKLSGMQHQDNCSTDSQFTESGDEDLSYLEACMECDEDAMYEMIHVGLMSEEVNERDRCGRTGLSHACGNGFVSILELLVDVDDLDVNIPDNEGNTPLIYASQAGHVEVVSFLLDNFKKIKVDQKNQAGMTALLKAAIQGRTQCAKLLLFAGASPKLRDYGRGLCALEWAKFTCRHKTAEAIEKFVNSRRFFFRRKFHQSKDKWSSEPDLTQSSKPREKSRGSWFKRSLKKVFRHDYDHQGNNKYQMTDLNVSPLVHAARCVSTPLLPVLMTPPNSPPPAMQKAASLEILTQPKPPPKVEVTSEDDLTQVGSDCDTIMRPHPGKPLSFTTHRRRRCPRGERCKSDAEEKEKENDSSTA